MSGKERVEGKELKERSGGIGSEKETGGTGKQSQVRKKWREKSGRKGVVG